MDNKKKFLTAEVSVTDTEQFKVLLNIVDKLRNDTSLPPWVKEYIDTELKEMLKDYDFSSRE